MMWNVVCTVANFSFSPPEEQLTPAQFMNPKKKSRRITEAQREASAQQFREFFSQVPMKNG